MTAYYNENDPFAAAWLRELIKDGLIAAGEVDTRSIKDVAGADLRGFTQVHLFAGIGGWSYALRLAGWPDDEPVWTGSCPCQPFSAAGKQRGTDDDRHLWPWFRDLIAECRPPVVFGEQVASKLGREWLAGVRTNMEALAYGVGAADLCAPCVGAPHIRQRLYWVADAAQQQQHGSRYCGTRRRDEPSNGSVGMELTTSDGWQQGRTEPSWRSTESRCSGSGLGHTSSAGAGRDAGAVPGAEGSAERSVRGEPHSPWASGVFVPCTDGKARRVEPSVQPLAHGVSGRVVVERPGQQAESAVQKETRWVNRNGALRGAGNAIVPQVAAEFIRAYKASNVV